MAERDAPPAPPERDDRQRVLLLAIRQGLILCVRAIEAYLGVEPVRAERR